MDEQLREGLTRLVTLYSRTKLFILQAEEADREYLANIAIIKGQLDEAWDHLLRAAYDSLDGVVVSYKLRLNEGMLNVSTDAISAVFPEYYTKVLLEMFELQNQIATFRSNKHVHESTFDDLDGYCRSVERLAELTKQVLTRVPAFNDWQRRDRLRAVVRNFAIPIAVGVIVFCVTFFVTKGCQEESHVTQSHDKPAPS